MTTTIIEISLIPFALTEKVSNVVPFNFPTPPIWTSSDNTIVTVLPNPNGSSANITTTGKLGKATITVSGTTADGHQIVGHCDITHIARSVTTIGLMFGAPVVK